MVDIKCETCGENFNVTLTRAKTAKFCSMDCRYGADRGKPNQICTQCGKDFYRLQAKVDRYNRTLGLFCSNSCTAAAKSAAWKGENNPNYKAVNFDQDGYKLFSPPASWQLGLGRMKLHQAVCCEILGVLKMPKGVHVHHRDCDILNNASDNLVVLIISDHKWLHKQYGIASLWAFCQGKIDLDDMVSWSDDHSRARRLLPLNVNSQTIEEIMERLE